MNDRDSSPPRDDPAASRQRLVEELRASGISDERVLSAVASVPRDVFVPPEMRPRAYENVALPIEEHQTISQPVVVAHMAQAVHPTSVDRVLEVGTGSGYGAAVLGRLAGDVVTIEIRPGLAQSAAVRLQRLGCDNVHVSVGDASLGWPSEAPYDAIVVTAASPEVAAPLLRQLSPQGGRLVAPVGTLERQELILTERQGSRLQSWRIGGVRFVPMRGAGGFSILDRSRRN